MKNKRLIFIALYIFLIFINGFSKELSIFRPSNVEYVAKGENKICAIMGNTLVDFNLTSGEITESGSILISGEMSHADKSTVLNRPGKIVFVDQGKWLLIYPKELIYWLPKEDKYLSLYTIDNENTIVDLFIRKDKIYLTSYKGVIVLSMEGKVTAIKEMEEAYNNIDFCEYGIVLWGGHNVSVLTESLEVVSQYKTEQQLFFCATDCKKSLITYGYDPKICNILKPNLYCVSNLYEAIKTYDGIDSVDFDESNWWFYNNLAGEGALLNGDVAIRSYPGKAFLRLKLPARVVGFKKINDNIYLGTPFGLLEVKTDNSEYALYARKMPVKSFNDSWGNNLNNEIIIKDLLLEENEKIFLVQKERSFLVFENGNDWYVSSIPYNGANRMIKEGDRIYYFGCQIFGGDESYDGLEGGLSYYDKVKGEHVNISKNPVTKVEILKEKIFYTVAKYLSSNDYDEITIEVINMEYDKTSGDNKRLTSKTMQYKFNDNQSDGIYAYPKSKEYKYDYKNFIERFIIIEKDGNKNLEPLKESNN